MEAKKFHFSTSKTFLHIFAYFLLFLAGDLLNSILFDLLFSLIRFQNYSLYAVLRMSGCTLITFLLFWLYTNKVLHLSMKDFKVTLNLKIWGVIPAVLLPAAVVSAFLFIGKTQVNAFQTSEIILVTAASLITALKAGILEEMLFRGFILTLLENRWNKYIAILAPSFLFSLLHIPSMEYFTPGGVLLLIVSGTLVGVMFSLAACRGNSISNGAFMHAVWNFAMITDILHITTADGVYGNPVISIIIPSDSMWLTGGGFGVEASLIAAVGYLLVCVLIVHGGKNHVYK